MRIAVYRRGLPVLLALGSLVAVDPRRCAASSADRIGQKLEDVTLRNLKGREESLLAQMKGGKALVIAFTGLGCPISGRYAPRLEEIRKKFESKGVAFVGINANPQDDLKAISKEVAQLGYGFPILQDKSQELTKQLDAKTSTEVFVVDKNRVIRYRGMIDDQYALGESRDQPKNRYLQKAIEAALAGRDPHITRTAAPGCVITRIDAADAKKSTGKNRKARTSAVTYASHISKIVQKHCVECHQPGQVGPFPLTSYEKVNGWSAMIDLVLRSGRMPPWNAAEEFDGVFMNERRMPKKDREMLLAWIDAGMPRGADAPKQTAKKVKPQKWRIGKPDRVFSMKDAYLVPKDGVVEYQYFTIPTDYKEDKWITAMEARPGAAEVVHHILAFVTDPKAGNMQPGRLGLEDGFLCATVPGDTPSAFPKGCAKKLPAGANVVLQMHYTTNGKAMRDKSSLALVFAKEPIQYEVKTRGIYNMSFQIPAGADNHEVKSDWLVDQDIELLGLFPHMHYRGKDWTYLVRHPDNKEEAILRVPRYNYRWQESYVFARPLRLTKGAKIECVAHFDNSEKNFANPNPKSPVKWGDQTWEEMMIGYVDYIPARPESKEDVGAIVSSPNDAP